MAKVDKYYGTYVFIYGDKREELINLGYKGSHSQFRIVCKAKSMAEANRIAKSYGLGDKVFTPDYTSETGNKKELELADKYGLIVCVNGVNGDDFVAVKDICNYKHPTDEMIEYLNSILKNEGSCLRYIDEDGSGMYNLLCVDKYVDNTYTNIPNVTEEFDKKVRSFFVDNYGAENIGYTNHVKTLFTESMFKFNE